MYVKSLFYIKHYSKTLYFKNSIKSFTRMLSSSSIPDFKFNEIHIRSTTDSINENMEQEENNLMISFYLCNDYHEMKRNKKEEMMKSFSRLLRNCHGKYDKQYKTQQKKKSKKSSTSEEPTIVVTSEGESLQKLFSVEEIQEKSFISFLSSKEIPIDITSLTNEDFQTGMIFNIFISPQISLIYDVIVNPPTVTSLSTYPRSIYTVNCPIVANVSIENAIDYECLWYCEDKPSSNNYCFVSSSKVFIPSSEQIGCKLKLYCTAADKIPAAASSSSCLGSAEEPTSQDSLIRKGRSFVFYLIHPIQGIPHKEQLLSRINTIRHHYHKHHRHHHHSLHKHKHNHNIHESHPEPQFQETDQQTVSHPPVSSVTVPSSDLRILSYNILSEGYCQQERSIDLLYGYVQNKLYLETEYRLQRIALELLSSSSDIIGLQECDKKVYDDYLHPLLSNKENDEYYGFYSNKESSVREGCALFLRKSSFNVLELSTLTLKEILKDASFLQPLYAVRPDLKDILGTKLGTIAQLAIVQDKRKNNEIIILANTHLFYHPLASYIRLLQIHVIIQKIEELLTKIQQFGLEKKEISNPVPSTNSLDNVFSKLQLTHSANASSSSVPAQQQYKVSVIFMGDLNCTPGVTGLGYLENGKVDIDCLIDSWERLCYFKWGNNAEDTADESDIIEKELDEKYAAKKKEKEKQEQQEKKDEFGNVGPLNPSLFTHSLNLHNTSKNLQYTNYTVGFKNLLDYIFISRNSLEVVGQAPMPSIEELEEETAIPSSVFPSDHVSIGIDIVYK
jgi:mRNA deadenylase 3'-5' endonuclease subunit Ccr4